MTSCLGRKTGVQGGLRHTIRLKTWKVQAESGEKTVAFMPCYLINLLFVWPLLTRIFKVSSSRVKKRRRWWKISFFSVAFHPALSVKVQVMWAKLKSICSLWLESRMVCTLVQLGGHEYFKKWSQCKNTHEDGVWSRVYRGRKRLKESGKREWSLSYQTRMLNELHPNPGAHFKTGCITEPGCLHLLWSQWQSYLNLDHESHTDGRGRSGVKAKLLPHNLNTESADGAESRTQK